MYEAALSNTPHIFDVSYLRSRSGKFKNHNPLSWKNLLKDSLIDHISIRYHLDYLLCRPTKSISVVTYLVRKNLNPLDIITNLS